MKLVIVGAGPVGLVAALYAQRAGLDVRVLEQRRKLPLDKACGEGLMPGGVAVLQDLGVDIPDQGSSEFTGIRWISDEVVADAPFPHGVGRGIRRTWLHEALWERAGELVQTGVEVHDYVDGGLETSKGRVEADAILGADGLHSRLRQAAGLDAGPGPVRRYGVRRHYTLEPWSDRVEVWWGEGVEAYVTPVGPERVGVAMLTGSRARFDEALAGFPGLVERLEGAKQESQDRGAGPLHQRARKVRDGKLLLVGDAAGYLDAVTGEGLALGFHQARAAVRALTGGPSYERAHARLVRLPFFLMHALLFAQRRPALRHAVVRFLAGRPALFSRLLELNDA